MCMVQDPSNSNQGKLTNNRYTQPELKLKFNTLLKTYDVIYTELEMYRVFASASASTDNPHCFNIRIHILIRGCG